MMHFLNAFKIFSTFKYVSRDQQHYTPGMQYIQYQMKNHLIKIFIFSICIFCKTVLILN